MKIPSDVKVLVLDGSPRDRGRVHGEALKQMISEVLERWKYQLSRGFKENPDRLIDRFVEETNFLPAVKKWTPQLLEEVRGISEGAKIDFEEIFALQLLDEGGWCLESLEQSAIEHCSSLGCFKEDGRPALVAQNVDWGNYVEGLEALLRIKFPDSDLEIFAFTVAGVIATCGLSNRPIGVCTNALWTSLNNSMDGLPVSFIVRAVLEQPDLERAIDFLHRIKHASAENYVIGDAKEVVDFECSASKICQYIPYKGARRVYHTNHPLVNDDTIFTVNSPRIGTSLERFNYLETRLKDPKKNITLETMKYILSSHEGPICVHQDYKPSSGYTFCSVIYSLAPFPELHLAVGPPCLKGYEKFSF